MPRKKIVNETGKAEKAEELSPEIKAEVEAAAEEESERRAKAQEILEAQAESKRLEILGMLDKAVKEWQETGSTGAGFVQPQSFKDKLKSNVQAVDRFKGRVLGLIRRLAELKSKVETTAEIKEEIEKIERELEKEGVVKPAEPKPGSRPLSVEEEIEKVYKEIEDI